MTERTGLEILEEILSRLDILEQKVDIIDVHIKNIVNNIKPVHSSITNVTKASIQPAQKPVAAEPIVQPASDEKGFHNFKFQPSDASKMKQAEPLADKNRFSTNKPGYIVCTGKMVASIDGKAVPLSGVDVTIFDDKDIVVKKTKTNKSGHWTSFLAPNKNYVALFDGEINGKKLVPVNTNFITPSSLQPGQTEFVVV